MQFLKANTAIDVLIGPFVDSTDGATAETALTISQADVKLSKNGQTLAQKSDVTAAAHDADGFYNCELDATDTNTEGCLVITISESGALPVRHEYMVLAEAAYDSMFTAKDTGYMDVNIKAVSEDTTAADNCEAFFDGTGYAGTGNTIPTVTTLTGHTAQTGDTYALANGATGFAAIDTVVDGIQTDLSNGTDGLGAIKADTAAILIDTDVIDDGTSGLVKIATDVAAILVDTGTTLDTKLNDIQGTTFSSATDSLEALRDRGDSAWTGSTVTSDSGTAQAGAAGTITLQAGASAIDDTYNGQLIYISSGTGAGQSRAISDYTGSSKVADVVTNWGTTPDGTSVYAIYPDEITEITAAPSAAAVADAVWDENTTGHQSAGTFGQQVKDDIDAILVDTAEIGTAGAGLTSLATQASVDTIDTNVDAILVDTGTTLNDKIDTIDTNVDSILVDTGTTLDDHLTDIKGTSFVKDTHSLTDIEAYVDILDDATSGNAKIATDAAAILVDTGTTLDTAIGTVDTVVDAIKVVTDKFAFTVANQVDANVESINATTVIGVGTSGNKWRA